MLFVRKQHLGFGWVASLLMLTGAASLGAAVVIQSNRLSELTSDRQLLLRDATRIRAVDALIGQRLPEDWMDGLALHPSGAIVWVVTPRSCPGCLSDLQAWNALAKRGVPTRLVLIGVDDSEARVIAARSRIASAVTVVPGTPLSNGLSFLPSTKVIVPAQATSLGCPPDVETCQDLPYVGLEGCTGTSCDSENQFCCLV